MKSLRRFTTIMSNNSRLQFSAIATLGVVLLAAGPAHSQYFKTLYNFQGSCCATSAPIFVQGRDNNLHSQIATGGIFSMNGSIYQMTPAGDISVLSNFDPTQLEQPSSPLTLGIDGNYYGLTRFGGPLGYGTFFRTASDGTVTVLHDFANGADGVWPNGALVRGNDVNFYGTSVILVPAGYAIFRVTMTGVVTTLAALDASHAPSSLILGKDGNFYGVAGQGTENYGSIFRLTPSGSWTVLYNFDNVHGAYPNTLVAGPGTNLFGVTASGGTKGDGVFFMVTPQGALTVLHNFDHTNIADGNFPVALILANDGKFYGATLEGGLFGDGEIFQVTTTGQFLVTHNFNKGSGTAPLNLMQHTNGKMYGSTNTGGIYNNLGTLFWFDWALKPFVSLETQRGAAGSSIGILGQGFTTATNVVFNGVPASYTVVQDGYLLATVPSGATSGSVQVSTATGVLTSSTTFKVIH